MKFGNKKIENSFDECRFIVTILLFTTLEQTFGTNTKIVYLWAMGLGLHSLAEGIIMGYNFHLGVSSLLLPFPALSFVMHKFAEGLTLAILMLITRTDNSNIDKTKLEPQILDRITILYLVIISVFPTFFGIILGYFDEMINLPHLTTRIQSILYTSSLAVVLSIFPNILPSQTNLEGKTKHQYLLGIVVGFLFLYLSAYFHEI